jgi:ProP effector
MGFEQLASLREELARQSAAKKREKQPKKNNASPTKKTVIVDPTVLIIGQLQKKFPLAFPKKPAPKVPLKIGIHKDLLEQVDRLGIEENELRAAIKTWCRGQRYRDCLVEDAVRVDLGGNAVGVVTKEEAQKTRMLKAKAKAKAKAKKAGVVKQPEVQQAISN